MREILFRGKRSADGAWVYGWFSESCYGRWHLLPRITPCKEAREGRYESFEVDPETVGEWTGLFDKKGMRIYEGDVLSNGKETLIAKWQRCRFILCKANHRPYSTAYLFKCEIVGNVFDNPELLQEEAT